MPTYSGSRYGSYQVTIPEYSTSVRVSIGAASGGGSYSPDGWNWSNGGFGRSGDFRLATRSYPYTLTFYLGQRGGNGSGNSLSSRGAGGSSSIASGGNGHRSGGGGGGASGIYDGGINRYTVIVGGGGGAGRFGQDTGYSGYYTAGRGIGGGTTTGSFSGRNGQNAAAGHRGGGGGGSNVGGAGGLGGAQTYNGFGGIGGNSAWYSNRTYYDWTFNSGYANYGDGFYVVSFDYAPPTIQYFTIDPDQFVQGSSARLRYSVTGFVQTVNLTPIGNNRPTSADFNISPVNDTNYTLSATGAGGNVSLTIPVDVLIPPQVTLRSSAPENTILLGESVNIDWTITGDASTANLQPGIGGVNIGGGPVTVTPSVTTEYTLVASHPIAGTGSDTITINVLNPPTTSLTGPLNVSYGQNITLDCSATNATQSLQLLAKYYYTDGTVSDYELVEELAIADVVEADVLHVIQYTNFGPSSIEYKLSAVGEGGQTSEDNHSVSIDIDQNPDVIVVPESVDKIRGENPVISPEEESYLTIVVDDIDIPVKIKADYPIQVEIDNDGIYRDVEQI